MEETNEVYSSYHSMSSSIAECIGQMSKCCQKLNMEAQEKALQASKDKLNSHTFAVGILGEFKRGKSTVINALLGEEVMPADILPSTATMNRVCYDLHKSVKLKLIDGTTEEITVEELPQYVTKQDEDSTARAAKIEEAVVYYPCQFCKNGVEIVDTPGLNDDERMNRITEKTVPKLDAVIMVLVHDSPFSISEADFVRNKLMCSDIGRLIFLVNKMDMIPRSKWQRVIDGIRKKIEASVIEKTAEVYGEDSEQYLAVKHKLADLQILPVSAFNGLGQVFQYGDVVQLEGEEKMQVIQRSGMPEFEAALGKLLTEERGVLELSGPVSKLISCANDAAMNIDQIKGSLDADEASFKETQRSVMEELNALKSKKLEEKKRLKQSAEELRASSRAQIADCYREIEAAAVRVIDGMAAPEGVTGKLNDSQQREVIARATKGIESEVEGIFSKYAERLNAQIVAAVQKEQLKISQDMILPTALKINETFTKLASNNQSAMLNLGAVVGVDFATNMLACFVSGALGFGALGVGGLIEGYKTAGAKGAALGGASGFALSFGTLYLLGGLGLGLVGGIPLLMISAVAGSLGGGAITGAVFRKDVQKKQLDELKKLVREELDTAIRDMKYDRRMEKWAQDLIEEHFDSLIAAMEQECDQVLEDAQRKLEEIKRNLALSHAERDARRRELDDIAEEIQQIMTTIRPLQDKLGVTA